MFRSDMSDQATTMRHFMMGPDGAGHWIVCDAEGFCGAVFRDKTEALHFARSECDAAPGAELRFVPSLDWRAILAGPAKKVA